MGFSKEATFNDLCGPKEADENDPHSCAKAGYWKIHDSAIEELRNKQDPADQQSHVEL